MIVRLVLALAAWAAGATIACAEPPPAAAFGRLPAIQDAAISPDGAHLAILGGPAGARSLNIAPIDGGAAKTTPLGDIEAVELFWAGDAHVIVRVGFWEKLAQRAEYRFERNIAFDLDGKPIANLLSNDHASRYATSQHVVRVVHGETPVVYLMGLQVAPDRSHIDSRVAQRGDGQHFKWALWRADPATGEGRLVEPGTYEAWGFEPDSTGEARIRLETDEKTELDRVWARAKGERRWSQVWSEADGGDYIGYSDPEDAIYLISVGETGHQVIRRRLADGVDERVGEASPYRPHLSRDPYTGRAIAISAGGESVQAQFLDAEVGAVHGLLSRALRDREVSLVSWSQDRDRYVIRAEAADAAPVWYLFDRARKELSPLADAYPELKDAPLGETRWITYAARDGLSIPAYVTTPPGVAAGKRPLIVLPHGGPHSRDQNDFDYLTQFLASRGYVVLRPQFRGSRGFGLAFERAGYGEWAGKMQTDLIDGVKALADAGVVDPDQVCIVGASYGGYAALASITMYPDEYRCAAAIAPVSDLQMLQLHEIRAGGRDSLSVSGLREMLGQASREQMAAGSPVTHAAAAGGPVLLLHGDQDTVVQLDHSVVMKNALERAGKPVELIVFEGENHYFYRPTSRIRMLQALEAFLTEHLPAD
ncbi:MAG: alpha/beta hydrolase family protein [Pseudomonadota bacterium]